MKSVPAENSPLLRAAGPRKARSLSKRPFAGLALVLVSLGLLLLWVSAPSSSPSLRLPTDAKHLSNVDVLASCSASAHETGYVTLPNRLDTHYFYWFFKAQAAHESGEDVPLVLWLSGGGSSIFAAMAENGPCRASSDGETLEPNPYGWNARADVLWVDQPTGQGFSYATTPVDAVTTSDEAADNVYWFLQEFLTKHPELQNRNFFMAGESYAGHYIPVSAKRILEMNARRTASEADAGLIPIDLHGIALGNALVNPAIQFGSYPAMLNNTYGISLGSPARAQEIREATQHVVDLIDECVEETPTNASLCVQVLTVFKSQLFTAMMQANHNVYDIRRECNYAAGELCYDFSGVEHFLNLPEVRDAMDINDHVPRWGVMNDSLTSDFAASGDWSMSTQDTVAELLASGVRVLAYVGDADLVCNWFGVQAWMKVLDWEHHNAFNAAPEEIFMAYDPLDASALAVEAGVMRKEENLTFLRVFNAGHMVPMDQPAVSLDMFNRFLANEL